jgi:YidC/Oxa1 family membrane protein insertase
VGAVLGFLTSLMAHGIALFYGVVHSYGWAIIFLTLAVRIVLMPISIQQLRSMRRMQLLSPEMQRLRERYKNEPQKLNQATMELFREAKVNPLAGCLPSLLQLPFLWGLYTALERYNYHHSGFLWLASLGKPDPFYILPLLTGLSTFLSMRVANPTTTMTTTDRSQQLITYILMPAFLAYIVLRLPSGVALYWVMSNLFTVAQQWLIVGRTRPPVVGPKAKTAS